MPSGSAFTTGSDAPVRDRHIGARYRADRGALLRASRVQRTADRACLSRKHSRRVICLSRRDDEPAVRHGDRQHRRPRPGGRVRPCVGVRFGPARVDDACGVVDPGSGRPTPAFGAAGGGRGGVVPFHRPSASASDNVSAGAAARSRVSSVTSLAPSVCAAPRKRASYARCSGRRGQPWYAVGARRRTTARRPTGGGGRSAACCTAPCRRTWRPGSRSPARATLTRYPPSSPRVENEQSPRNGQLVLCAGPCA